MPDTPNAAETESVRLDHQFFLRAAHPDKIVRPIGGMPSVLGKTPSVVGGGFDATSVSRMFGGGSPMPLSGPGQNGTPSLQDQVDKVDKVDIPIAPLSPSDQPGSFDNIVRSLVQQPDDHSRRESRQSRQSRSARSARSGRLSQKSEKSVQSVASNKSHQSQRSQQSQRSHRSQRSHQSSSSLMDHLGLQGRSVADEYNHARGIRSPIPEESIEAMSVRSGSSVSSSRRDRPPRSENSDPRIVMEKLGVIAQLKAKQKNGAQLSLTELNIDQPLVLLMTELQHLQNAEDSAHYVNMFRLFMTAGLYIIEFGNFELGKLLKTSKRPLLPMREGFARGVTTPESLKQFDAAFERLYLQHFRKGRSDPVRSIIIGVIMMIVTEAIVSYRSNSTGNPTAPTASSGGGGGIGGLISSFLGGSGGAGLGSVIGSFLGGGGGASGAPPPPLGGTLASGRDSYTSPPPPPPPPAASLGNPFLQRNVAPPPNIVLGNTGGSYAPPNIGALGRPPATPSLNGGGNQQQQPLSLPPQFM